MPAIKDATPGHQYWVIDESIRQKNISWLGLFGEPVDQRIVSVSNLAPVGVVDREEINYAARNDYSDEKNCDRLPRDRNYSQRETPQAPNRLAMITQMCKNF